MGESYQILPGKDADGGPIFSVLVKRTYDIRPAATAVRAETPAPLIPVDVYYEGGSPETVTIKHESDLVPYKVATDVVVIGKAYSPRGKPTAELDVAVTVANRRKVLHITGDRRCIFVSGKAPRISEPEEFCEMEIRYERAYGGSDAKSDPERPFMYPRNVLGVGLAVQNLREVVDGLALPNIEDPGDRLTPERVILGEPKRWNAQPLPQGFGWYPRTGYPRCSFSGAMPPFVSVEEPLREEGLGLVPAGQVALSRQFKLPSYDARFASGASLGLVFPYLQGDEQVRLWNLTPDSDLQFALPGETPRMMVDIGGGETELKPELHTVCIRPDDLQLDLVWRGALVYPGVHWLPKMQRLVAKVA